LEPRSVGRELAAIFVADVEGHSRLIGRDEVGTLRTLTAYRVTVDRLIVSHRGRLFEDHWRRVSSSSARRMRCGVPGGDDRGSG